MIFVTVGSAVKGVEFTRLIEKMDKVATEIDEEVVMQIGTIPYEPRNAKYFRYASYEENLSFFQKASLVIGHCGIGTILNALRFKKPLIVVPRRTKYGELNRDDHQIEIAQRLEGKKLIEVVYDVENLESAIKRVLERGRYVTKGESSFEKDNLIKTLQEFIKSCT